MNGPDRFVEIYSNSKYCLVNLIILIIIYLWRAILWRLESTNTG
jgi:hypothetical protein